MNTATVNIHACIFVVSSGMARSYIHSIFDFYFHLLYHRYFEYSISIISHDVILSLYYQSTHYWMHCQHIRYQSALHIANIHPPQSLPKWPKPLWYSIVLRIQLLLDPNSTVSIYFHLPPVLQNRAFEIRLFHCCKGCLL